jgi:predicted DNA-binding antitoxin AbrB/MazE fold protein
MEIAMRPIEAIFRNGVFEPLQPVDLPEGERVRLDVQLMPKETPEEWLACVRKRQAEIFERHGGFLPDSTLDIAEDRMR